MKTRLVIVFTLAMGLALLVSWAMAVQEVAAADVVDSPENTASPSTDLPAARLGVTADITFTPEYTAFLPAVFKNYINCTAVPTLLSPANGSSLATLAPLFRWDNGNDPSVTALRMQVSKDASFATYVNSLYGGSGTHEFRFSRNYDPATVYYWRAWLVCGDVTQGPNSEVWSFTTGSGGTILPAVSLTSPANGSTVSGSTVTLRWSAVSGAIEYLVRWRETGEGGYIYTWVTGTQYTVGGLSANTTYEWWVSARNSYAIGTDSATWQFTTPAGLLSGAPQSESVHTVVEDGRATRVLEGHSRK
jgi:hypothetical protein